MLAGNRRYPNTPGIYTEEQINAWKPVTQAVRDAGGVFFLQLWHCGRSSHPGKLLLASGRPPRCCRNVDTHIHTMHIVFSRSCTILVVFWKINRFAVQSTNQAVLTPSPHQQSPSVRGLSTHPLARRTPSLSHVLWTSQRSRAL